MVLAVFALLAAPALAQNNLARLALAEERRAAYNALARSLLKELIEINTTESSGSVTAAAEAMAAHLRAAGYRADDIRILGANDRKKNLVARLRGTGQMRPVLILGHLDVVEARRSDWSTDPFKLVEKDGYLYGRGVVDMKSGDAIMTAAMIRLRRENFRPPRDIILALTADEESGDANGVSWLLKNHRELLDAQFVINHDGTSILADHGQPQYYELDETEKVYADYQLIATDPGGHSSLPRPDNAIYTLTAALDRLAQYEFPFELNAVTRRYYEALLRLESADKQADIRAILHTPPEREALARLMKDPLEYAITHTTCTPTRLDAGHANNALPQRAVAIINCRILPGHGAEEVRQDIIRAANDRRLTINFVADDGTVLPAAPQKYTRPAGKPDESVLAPLRTLVHAYWPGLRIVPSMAVGASDAIFTEAAGLPTYTVTGIMIDRDDDRSHGRDERLPVRSFERGSEFFYDYLQLIAAPDSAARSKPSR